MNNKITHLITLLVLTAVMTSCNQAESTQPQTEIKVEATDQVGNIPEVPKDKEAEHEEKEEQTEITTKPPADIPVDVHREEGYYYYKDKAYQIIEVDGGSRSGSRQSNVAVDIGFGERNYWGLTNEYGQLVYVIADKIILQNDKTEPVNSKGRYYDDEANVPGTERSDLDQGHVIADSLGGVSNAYNITPQESTLNRHGDQAYMEKAIREAGGCTNFVATITYPNTTTQIPKDYKYEYVIKGNQIIDEFPNDNPEITTEHKVETESVSPIKPTQNNVKGHTEELSKIDTNGNGKVTIKEAKAAGYKMPIYADHWLYQYMDDRDGDGVVGE